MSARPESASAAEPSGYLPDFCSTPVVVSLVLVAALLAVVLALARQGAQGDFLVELGRTSLYLLWTTLLCAAALCKARTFLARRSLPTSTAWALALIVATVAVVSVTDVAVSDIPAAIWVVEARISLADDARTLTPSLISWFIRRRLASMLAKAFLRMSLSDTGITVTVRSPSETCLDTAAISRR